MKVLLIAGVILAIAMALFWMSRKNGTAVAYTQSDGKQTADITQVSGSATFTVQDDTPIPAEAKKPAPGRTTSWRAGEIRSGE